MTVDDVEKLIDSPVRREIAKRLEAGHASVMVLLGGVKESAGEGEETKLVDDTEATVAAQKEVEKLIEDITAGKVNLYATPNETGFPEKPAEEPESEEETEATEQPEHEVSFVKVSRTDPKEAWLVRSLMSIEDDLYEFNEPMVFAVYGRARALPPYIGKGITRDNLIDCVDFVTGACSCTVKEQNPGMDLLVRYDWETAAEKVAERFGAEEGNEFKFSSEDFFPQLLIPPADEPETTEVSVNETDSSNEPDGATDTQPKETDDNNDDEVVAEKNPIADENETDVAHANLPTQATNPQEMIVETSKSGTFIVGIGLVFRTPNALRSNLPRTTPALKPPTSFNGKPKATVFRAHAVAFGSPLNERIADPHGITTHMISLQNVSKIYPSALGEVRALDELSLDIDDGEFVAVRGESGSGKSTLLAIVGGLAVPTSGEVQVADKSLHRLTASERAEFRAHDIGFVFQLFHLLPYLTVLDNILLASNEDGVELNEKAESLIERFGLAKRKLHRPPQLSAGERQRVAMARAMLNEPKLLLADEPTGNLDPKNATVVLDLIADFHQDGGTVLLVTHDDHATSYAKRTIELDRGKVCVGETPR